MGFTSLPLRENEKLLISGAANMWVSETVSLGGKLFLTNQRVVFQAHALNFVEKKNYSWELKNIETNGSSFNIKVAPNKLMGMLVSYNITFNTTQNETLSFVVTKKQKDEWVQGITNALTENIHSNIQLPPGISSDQASVATSMVKVVQCESCGAFLVVTAGNVTKCEYCDRPYTFD